MFLIFKYSAHLSDRLLHYVIKRRQSFILLHFINFQNPFRLVKEIEAVIKFIAYFIYFKLTFVFIPLVVMQIGRTLRNHGGAYSYAQSIGTIGFGKMNQSSMINKCLARLHFKRGGVIKDMLF